MPEEQRQPRFHFLVAPEVAGEFEAALKGAVERPTEQGLPARVLRPTAQGKVLIETGVAIKLIVAVGGGAGILAAGKGIAAVIDSIVRAVEKFMPTGDVAYSGPDGTVIELKNSTPEELRKVLEQQARAATASEAE